MSYYTRNRLFYYNSETDQASWKPPRGIKGGKVLASSNVESADVEVAGALVVPQGYTEHQDPVSGAIYFIVRIVCLGHAFQSS